MPPAAWFEWYRRRVQSRRWTTQWFVHTAVVRYGLAPQPTLARELRWWTPPPGPVAIRFVRNTV